jgi:hypothetical protein
MYQIDPLAVVATLDADQVDSVREYLAHKGVVFVVDKSLSIYPEPTIIMSTACPGPGTYQLTGMFWDVVTDGRRGRADDVFVLTNGDHACRRHTVEVCIQRGDERPGSWVISVVASMHTWTKPMAIDLLAMFKCILRLRRSGLFGGKLYYCCKVAVMEDRTRSVFGPLVTNKALMALMLSWLPVEGVIGYERRRPVA